MRRLAHRARRAVLLGSLAQASAGAAAVFTVGPTGDFATIQTAIDAALVAGGENEVRVARGTYAERLSIDDTPAVTSLALRGGWDAAFATQALDPQLTVVDATLAGRALQSLTRFTFVVEALTFRRGRLVNESGDPQQLGLGGGVKVSVYGGSLVFRHCRVEDSKLEWDGLAADGGGMYAEGNAPIEIADSTFVRNAARSLDIHQTADGGGLKVFNVGPVHLARLVFDANRVESETAAGAALAVLAQLGKAVVEDVVITRTFSSGEVPVGGQGATLVALSQGEIDARRLRVSGSTPKQLTSAGAEPYQVYVGTVSTGSARLADSLVHTSRNGVAALADGSGFLRLVNLTVTGHSGTGVALNNLGAKTIVLANSIVAQNQSDLFPNGKLTLVKNLAGKDPKFVNAKKKNFRLTSASPAANAGSHKVAGGLSATDLEGLARVKGAKVDIGAYESQ